MNEEFPLIQKIKRIPIQINRQLFIEKYLQIIGKEMAAFFQVEHCGILLFTKSTLLKDLLVETYERQSVSFEYLDLDSLPWLTKKDNHQNIIHLSDLKILEDKDPLKQTLVNCLSITGNGKTINRLKKRFTRYYWALQMHWPN
jgi:hypothetical protein